VAEVASLGGFVKEIQITVDVAASRAAHLAPADLASLVAKNNIVSGSGVAQIGETQFAVRTSGGLRSLDDVRNISVGLSPTGKPILLRDIADVQFGPAARDGLAEFNGEGESVGGIVILRPQVDTRAVIRAVKSRLDEAVRGSKSGIDYTIVYDRTSLIDRAVAGLARQLVEEAIVVAVVCALFLLHPRSAGIAFVFLPVAILVALALLRTSHASLNVMSLGGIAIAVGAMIDAVIVMMENVHKHVERNGATRAQLDVVRKACAEVGPRVFWALIVMAVSFLPVLALESQEGRLFRPLLLTKTYAMGAAALLSVTLAPVLMFYFITGRLRSERRNPISQLLVGLYNPVFNFVMRRPRLFIGGGIFLVAFVFFPWDAAVVQNLPLGPWRRLAARANVVFPYQNLGTEFLPNIDEGDLLYMPTTAAGLTPNLARDVLQQMDETIRAFPEVRSVFGKAGRAATPMDPAPMEMFEILIQLRPRAEWPAVTFPNATTSAVTRRKRTPKELVQALDRALQFPGFANAWSMPIRTRIDMLSTGVRSVVGIKISGPDPAPLEFIGAQIATALKRTPGTRNAFVEQQAMGDVLECVPDRLALARFGLSVADIDESLQTAGAGLLVTTTIDSTEHDDIRLRSQHGTPRSREEFAALPIWLPSNPPEKTRTAIPLSTVATLRFAREPVMIATEATRPTAYILIDLDGSVTNLENYIGGAKQYLEKAIAAGGVTLPPGFALQWSGEYEDMLRANARLRWLIFLTLLLVATLTYVNTKSAIKSALILLSVPFSLIGAVVIMSVLHYPLSVATWVGTIALAGLDIETGVVMILYLDLAWAEAERRGQLRNPAEWRLAIHEGAVARVRPKIMTAAVIVAGLLPILWSTGAGAEVMKRMAAPMVGGVVTSTLMELLLYPALYYSWRTHESRAGGRRQRRPPDGFDLAYAEEPLSRA
jgi:Cu(I)/Ag(I) efflux system membrane protein CusA/SilA